MQKLKAFTKHNLPRRTNLLIYQIELTTVVTYCLTHINSITYIIILKKSILNCDSIRKTVDRSQPYL